MSHKTGKRVLTASTSLALAVVGLAASPLAAHATPGDVTMTDNCGTNDTVAFAKNTGTYDIFRGGSRVISVDTNAGTSSTPATAGAASAVTAGTPARAGFNATFTDNTAVVTTALPKLDATGKSVATGATASGTATPAMASQFRNAYFQFAENLGITGGATVGARTSDKVYAVSGKVYVATTAPADVQAASIWTQTFDNRGTVTPTAPQFIDKTGLVDDGVMLPSLQNGLDGYRFALGASGDSQPADNTFKYVDYTWYGKQVSLTDLQRAWSGTPDPTKVKIWIKTKANGTTFLLAKDASGNDVPSSWTYTYTNSVNVVPVAPTQTSTGANSYTLTFPVDATVIYSVTDANGVTKDVAYGDLGKALPYTGTTTVRARAASSIYVIQPNTDGSAPSPWTYTIGGIKPQPPTKSNPAGTANDTYTLPAQTGIVWNVNGKDVPLSAYGSPISTGGATSVVVIAQAGAGYTLDSTAQAKWTLDFPGDEKPTNAQVSNSIVSGASVPTTVFHWSADNATSYDVTYHKTLLNGSAGPEIDWMMDTTDTEAKFVAEPGDEYTVTVVAKNDNGDAEPVSSTVKFDGNPIIGDITTGQGTFSAGWTLLGKAQLSGLPYYGDTAALASNGATWTYTVPAGTKSFDLFATVHSLGAKGKIWVNGVNWANFETNPSYWGTVSNPYGYPVRRVQGWDNTKPATITVQQTEGGSLYLALDAYRVNK